MTAERLTNGSLPPCPAAGGGGAGRVICLPSAGVAALAAGPETTVAGGTSALRIVAPGGEAGLSVAGVPAHLSAEAE